MIIFYKNCLSPFSQSFIQRRRFVKEGGNERKGKITSITNIFVYIFIYSSAQEYNREMKFALLERSHQDEENGAKLNLA